tara:strand:+ start:88 stop:549 length:462 start_codon:yes stop_codon:yes gene_type:complete
MGDKAGTKYTRKAGILHKPVKKQLTKRQAEMKKINKGIKKTIARNKKPVLGRALKNTVKGLGRGAMAVGSMSPVGRGLKAAKVIKKAVKVVKKKRALKANPKYLKSDYAYKKKLQKRSSNAKTQKQQNKIEKELDLMNPNLTMDQRAKLLGGY